MVLSTSPNVTLQNEVPALLLSAAACPTNTVPSLAFPALYHLRPSFAAWLLYFLSCQLPGQRLQMSNRSDLFLDLHNGCKTQPTFNQDISHNIPDSGNSSPTLLLQQQLARAVE